MTTVFTDNIGLANLDAGDCNWDDEWRRNQFIKDVTTKNLLSLNRVLAGCAISDHGGLDIKGEEGSILIGDQQYSIDESTKTATGAAPEAEYLTNWVYFNSDGVLQVNTALPSGNFLLVGYVDADQTSLLRVVDLRPFASDSGMLTAITKIMAESTEIVELIRYDTTKDSDGGAWRKKCANLSWYGESLGTSTRGETREFPAIAYILAEKSKVTIFDATDKDLPMWMVFTIGTILDGSDYLSSILSFSSAGISSIGALNSRVVVANSDSICGITVIDFSTDKAISYTDSAANTSQYYGMFGGWFHGIAKRNETIGYDGEKGKEIIDRKSHAVSLYSLKETPINSTTGLKNPTIAIATNGGVSIIDGPGGIGSIVNMTCSNAATKYSEFVRFLENGDLMYSFDVPGDVKFIRVHQEINLPESDLVVTAQAYLIGLSKEFYSSDDNSTNYSMPVLVDGTDDVLCAVDGAIGGGAGLTMTKFNSKKSTVGLVNYITDMYQSGWQCGAIKLAALSDVITGNVSGTNNIIDRSHNGNDLDVIGTLDREQVATGADLVAFTDFSTSNYIKEAYNSDYDYGTDDFYVAGWIKSPTADSSTLLNRSDTGSGISAGSFFLVDMVHSKPRFVVGSSDSTQTSITSADAFDDIWTFIVARRYEGKISISVNGKLDKTATATAYDMDNTSAELLIGALTYGGAIANANGKIALVRTGKSMITDEQIKFMYEAEKHLFGEYAHCLITGGSKKIVDLQYNKETNTHAITTDTGGINIFQDLVRIDFIDSFSTEFPTTPWINTILFEGGILAADSSKVYTKINAVNLREPKIDCLKGDPVDQIEASGELYYKIVAGRKPIAVFVDGKKVKHSSFSIDFDGFNYWVGFPIAPTSEVIISTFEV